MLYGILLLSAQAFGGESDHLLTNGCVDFSKIGKEDTPYEIKHRLLAVISKEDNDYSVDPSTLTAKKKFNNCLTLKDSTNPGVSAGPVFNNDGEVVGCCLGGSRVLHYYNILCAKYDPTHDSFYVFKGKEFYCALDESIEHDAVDKQFRYSGIRPVFLN